MPQNELVKLPSGGQLSFGGGVNAQVPAHLLPEDTVQTATNIDFTIERGAARVRRGSKQVISTPYLHYSIFKSYANNISNSVVYSNFQQTGTAAGTYGVLRGTVGGTYATIALATQIGDFVWFGKYKDFTYVSALGPGYIKDDGTNTTYWIPQSPPAPTITINTATAVAVGNGTYTVPEGTIAGGTATVTSTGDATTFRSTFLFGGIGSPTDYSTNGTNTIGNAGIHYVDLAFSDPQQVYRISYDFAIGDSTFENYMHGEVLPNLGDNILSALPDVNQLIDSQLVGTDTSTSLSQAQRAQIQSIIKDSFQTPVTNISQTANVFGGVGIARTNFNLVGPYDVTSGADPWSVVYAVRVIVESYQAGQITQLRTPVIKGDLGHALNDMNLGYTWWQTWATSDAQGNIVSESGPSAPSSSYKVQHANATVVNTNTATNGSSGGNTIGHGITHVITYRQGGYTNDAYAVSTTSYGTNTFTDTVNDIQALSLNFPMTRNLFSASSMPGDVAAIAPENWFDRMFISHDNIVQWSLPGRPSMFPKTSQAEISNSGDNVQGLVVWPPGLVIVNRDSVFEMYGSVFEGANTDFIIQRSGARKGCIPRRCIIKTPYGIPLVNYDGISMYIPGQGVDKNLDWVTEQIGDAWRGTGSGDPAALNGNRVPAINFGVIIGCGMAYNEGKLYFGAPTGTSSFINTVFVLDFTTKKCQWFDYGSNIQFMGCPYWDFLNNTMLVPASSGIWAIETGTGDGVGGTSAIAWTLKSRAWTSPQDAIMENLAIEYTGGTGTALAVYDGTSTGTLGTFSSSAKTYTIPTFGGTLRNNVYFQISGTTTSQPTSIYRMEWDAIEQPKEVTYYREDYSDGGYEGDKLWNVLYCNLGIPTTVSTATVTLSAVTFVDNVVVMTNTITATGNRNKDQENRYTFAFPVETYGRNVYTTYTSANVFKYWSSHYDAVNEPPRINYWKSDVQSLEEQICDAWDVDLAPNGTVLGTVFVDNTAVQTASFVGTGLNKRQSFTATIPVETYGRTVFVEYTGTSFKHYKTWFHLRQEPDRWTSYVTPRESAEESIWDAVDCDINPLGNTVLATTVLDGTALATATLTGTKRQSFTNALPNESYGRTAYVVYNVSGSTPANAAGAIGTASSYFKHYQTWFHKRPEPDRWTNYVSDRKSFKEHLWGDFACDINPLGNSVVVAQVVDGTTAQTSTFTGSFRDRFVTSLPNDIYGKTVYAIYTVAGTGRFKWYSDTFTGVEEPDRTTSVQQILPPFSSDHYLHTWVSELNPLGTCTGTLIVDGTAINTHTFVGTYRQTYQVGIDVNTSMSIQSGTSVEARYSSGAVFKFYQVQVETDAKPFGKTTWDITYKKSGGASQIDMARFWSIDIEASPGSTATVTSVWDIDEQSGFSTNTFTVSTRTFMDRIPFPPGGRGRLFQQRILASGAVKVWRSNMDEEHVGVKGLARTTIEGTPRSHPYSAYQYAG